MEVILGAKSESEHDISSQQHVEAQITTVHAEQKAKIAKANGTLFTSVFTVLSQALPNANALDKTIATTFKSSRHQCLESDENGQQRLTIALPSHEALDAMARALAALMTAGWWTGTQTS
ncbi:MAG: hypothetical protein Q8M07_13740 [Prosthecobacter sp.]|nr:hypothetical protein [Prosthecobacter sp.]